jgi:hypothetical protein
MTAPLPPIEFPGPREDPQLAADLTSISGRQRVPDELDLRVLGDLNIAARPVAWGRRLAVAAMVVVAIGSISLFMMPQLASQYRPASRAAWDVTLDGHVDVLDAFVLAKTIEQGEFDDFSDFNQDGRVDASDLAVLTAHVVQLDVSQDTGS